MILRKHLFAGGYDIRKVTRERLQSMDAPLRCFRKKGVSAKEKKRLTFYKWAGAQQTQLRHYDPDASRWSKLGSRDDYRERVKDLKDRWGAGDRSMLDEPEAYVPTRSYDSLIGPLLSKQPRDVAGDL